MLDVVALLESAGAGTAFDRVDADLAGAVDAFLADDTRRPAIVACMIATPDNGDSDTGEESPADVEPVDDGPEADPPERDSAR